jgi:hypothetical protein
MDFSKLGWVGWILTAITWAVAITLNRRTTRTGEVNKAIDTFNSIIVEVEDLALEFWLSNSPNVYEYQLNLQLKRATNAARVISNLDPSQGFPSEEMSNFRQSVTLFTASDKRGIPAHHQRARTIMSSSVKLQSHFSKQV